MTREWDKWNEFGVTKFLSKKQLNDITEKVIQGKPDYKARLVAQGCQEDKGLHQDRCTHWIARRPFS